MLTFTLHIYVHILSTYSVHTLSSPGEDGVDMLDIKFGTHSVSYRIL